MSSSFFRPGSTTREGRLALLHLKRDQQLPVILSTVPSTADDKGYAEGVVTNTKFGSFPHSTLIDVPWGSQILASKVDTGSRGRKPVTQGQKRKADAISKDSPDETAGDLLARDPTAASSGFIHILPPTPESWTTSLPHRTQVVYTPDYSYVLHRIRARPGSRIIEAGSGSGSFTHAAARAVYDGKPTPSAIDGHESGDGRKTDTGQVFTFEFHAERHQKIEKEMEEHGLDALVVATHRDVYKDGFLIASDERTRWQSPRADAIFLDLPAPWQAIPHLTRSGTSDKPSALNPDKTVHICTFSPCIEQVQKTMSTLRRSGWIDIEMVEIQHKRIDVRREYTGLQYDGMRSVNAVAVDVDEAVSKLRSVESKARELHSQENKKRKNAHISKPEQNKQQDAAKTLYKDGAIVHRDEPDIKTHTSYLVFAILPCGWSEEDEVGARESLPDKSKLAPDLLKSNRQHKKESKDRKMVTNGPQDIGAAEI